MVGVVMQWSVHGQCGDEVERSCSKEIPECCCRARPTGSLPSGTHPLADSIPISLE